MFRNKDLDFRTLFEKFAHKVDMPFYEYKESGTLGRALVNSKMQEKRKTEQQVKDDCEFEKLRKQYRKSIEKARETRNDDLSSEECSNFFKTQTFFDRSVSTSQGKKPNKVPVINIEPTRFKTSH